MRHPLHLSALLLALFGASCAEPAVEPVADMSEIHGTVVLTYVNGGTGSNAGVVVRIEELSGRSGTTNDSGAYEIGDVPDGVYTLVFERPGFGHLRTYGIEVDRSSRVTAPAVSLGEIPRAAVATLNAFESGDRIVVTGAVTEDGLFERQQVVALYFATDAGVSNDPREHRLRQLVEVDRGARTFRTEISNTYLRSLGLASNTTLHVVGYVMDFFATSKYMIPGVAGEYATSLNGPSTRDTVSIP